MVSWVGAPSKVRPSVADLSGGEDSLHTLGDLRTNPVTLDESDSVVSLVAHTSISNHLGNAGAVTRHDVGRANIRILLAQELSNGILFGRICSEADLDV